MRKALLAFLFVFSASLQAQVCIQLMKKLSPYPGFAIGIGDRVRVSFNGGKAVDALFIGNQEGGHYFFFDPGKNKLFSVEASEITSLIAEGRKLNEDELQTIPSVPCQGDGINCAVHAAFNGVRFLSALGLVPPSVTKSLHEDPGVIWSRLSKSPLNFEHYDGRFNVDGNGPKQNDYGLKELQQMGIASSITDSAKAIRRHLEAGKPAMLSVNLALEGVREHFSYGGDGSPIVHPGRGSRPFNIRGFGGHTVLAVGFLRTGFWSGKLVVLDSGTGGIELWDWSDVKKATHGGILLGAE